MAEKCIEKLSALDPEQKPVTIEVWVTSDGGAYERRAPQYRLQDGTCLENLGSGSFRREGSKEVYTISD